jgi:hypothetical protein
MDFENPDNFLGTVKLQALEPLKPLDISKTVNFQKHLSKPTLPNDLLSPINVFGGVKEEPEGSKHVNKSPRIFYGAIDGRINPLHYKTRDMCKDYNSLMNKLYPNEDKGSVIEDKSLSNDVSMIEDKSIEDKSSIEEDPSLICNPKSSIIDRSNIEKESLSKLEKLCNDMEMKHSIESKIITSLEPNPKEYELEDAIIETLSCSKKKCVIWWEGVTIPYNKFRENNDNVIFFVGEDAYGYSKKSLYEEYMKSQYDTKSRHEVKSRVYFDLDLNWEDGEILWVPMSQILRILEFSHPVYELQKTKFSTKVWNTIPVKLQK